MNAGRGATFDGFRTRSSDQTDSIARVTFLANMLDSAVFLPGLNRRIGLDSVIGLVPGIGDAVSAALASYIIFEAHRLGLPRRKIARMIGNVAIDTALGAIPIAGDLFDVFYKANQRNLRIIHEHIGAPKRGPRQIDGTAVTTEGKTR